MILSRDSMVNRVEMFYEFRHENLCIDSIVNPESKKYG